MRARGVVTEPMRIFTSVPSASRQWMKLTATTRPAEPSQTAQGRSRMLARLRPGHPSRHLNQTSPRVHACRHPVPNQTGRAECGVRHPAAAGDRLRIDDAALTSQGAHSRHAAGSQGGGHSRSTTAQPATSTSPAPTLLPVRPTLLRRREAGYQLGKESEPGRMLLRRRPCPAAAPCSCGRPTARSP